MKKTILFLLALLMTFALLPAAYAETTTTVLMYMCGTDLQSACVEDMYEMCTGNYSDQITVAVQAGGATEWDDSDLTPNALTRFTIADGGFYDLEVLDWASMGEQQTLVDFLKWGVSYHPADRYMLVLWNHGGGAASGVCFDETADYDSLTLHELNDALYQFTQSRPGFRFDVIGFDACLMATYETAAHMRYYADYMVASEKLEPGIGWNYDGWLSALSDQPDMDSQSLAVAVADAYMEAAIADNPDDYLSMSVVYLPAMDAVVQQMENYAAYLTQALDSGELATFSRARQRMYAFGEFSDASSDMVDMAALLAATRSMAPQTASALESAYQKAVRYNVGTETFDYLTGLSVYFPIGEFETETYACAETYPNYTQFVQGYTALRAGGDYVFTAQAPQQLNAGNVEEAFAGNVVSSSVSPAGVYVAQEETPEEWEDVTADLPPVTSLWSGLLEQAVVGEITPEETESGGFWSWLDSWGSSTDSDAVYACSMQLSEDELNNLSLVEGLLYMDASDEEDTVYVELGAMQNAGVNWETGEIVSNFDGCWPMLDDQLVVLYDQLVNGGMRRSIIPVKCNGKEGYLLVIRKSAEADWSIVGFTRGYDEQGLPVRGSTPLKAGDEIIPTYPMVYEDEDGEMQEDTFDGDPIIVGEEGTIEFGFYSLEGSESSYLYCFQLTDIYGETQWSEFISFEL